MLSNNFNLIIWIRLECRKTIHDEECSSKIAIVLIKHIVLLFLRVTNKMISKHGEDKYNN